MSDNETLNEAEGFVVVNSLRMTVAPSARLLLQEADTMRGVARTMADEVYAAGYAFFVNAKTFLLNRCPSKDAVASYASNAVSFVKTHPRARFSSYIFLLCLISSRLFFASSPAPIRRSVDLTSFHNGTYPVCDSSVRKPVKRSTYLQPVCEAPLKCPVAKKPRCLDFECRQMCFVI